MATVGRPGAGAIWAAALVLWASVARADPASDKRAADALVEQGKQLGLAGKLDEAVARFKAAEARFPRPEHDCNIGYAYKMQRRPARAFFFLERCRSRISKPETQAWAQRQLGAVLRVLRASSHAPVELLAEPAGARVVVSAFAPDEIVVPPRMIWLPFGRHTLTTTLDGHEQDVRVIEVSSKAPQRHRILLAPSPPLAPAESAPVLPPAPPPVAAVPAPPKPAVVRPIDPPPARRQAPAEPQRGVWPWVALGVGAASVTTGVVFHVLARQSMERARGLPEGGAYRAEVSALERDIALTYVGYGVGAAAIGAGSYLLLRPEREGMIVSAAPVPGGAVVALRWER